MADYSMPKAIIYARVSSKKQVKEGHGLQSQEKRCREYAQSRGYEVVQVFRDDISGKGSNRPGIKSMLRYLEDDDSNSVVVIIDDISRIARDLESHIRLTTEIAMASGKLESPNLIFGTTSDERLIEMIMAVTAQYGREKNAEQVIDRMTARLQMGYWHFNPPIGYVRKKVSGHGKMLVRDEPFASIVKEVLEGYANGRFQSPAEISAFLRNHPQMQQRKSRVKFPFKSVVGLLSNQLYTGFYEYPEWGIGFMKGHHEPLISLETHKRIIDKLAGRPIAPARKDLNKDFPLRGFLQCGSCGHHLTGAWSKGRSKYYGYYECHNPECSERRKSLSKTKVEEEFSQSLKELEPAPEVFAVAESMLRDMWHEKQGRLDQDKAALQSTIGKIEREKEAVIDRLVSADDAAVIEAYEKRLSQLARKESELTQSIDEIDIPNQNFDDLFEPAMRVLSTPWKIWENGSYPWKRALLRMVFSEEATYSRKWDFEPQKPPFLSVC